MKVKIDNIDQLNDILFYAGFGCAKDSLVCVMNYDTLTKIVRDFRQKYRESFGEKWSSSFWENPFWFAANNGVHFAIGDWLEYGEVDIKL